MGPLVNTMALSAMLNAVSPAVACEALTDAQRERVAALSARERPYDCCDESLSACLKKKQICRLTRRLQQNICRRVAAGEDDAAITRALSRRARTMVGFGRKARFDLAGFPPAGDPAAPVTVVVYADANGPNCARLVPPFYRALTAGPLQGKAKLYLKPFPLRRHAFAKQGGLAFLVAADLGRLWELALYFWDHFPDYTPDKEEAWVAAAGLEPTGFATLVVDPAIADRLLASKKEGLDNGVTSTPTFFIAGHEFHGDLTVAELIDVVEEAHDRATGRTYLP